MVHMQIVYYSTKKGEGKEQNWKKYFKLKALNERN